MRHITAVLAASPVLLAAAVTPAQETAPACNDNAIAWFVPGQFDQALQKARSARRLLVIKGISFGVDEVGAKCATKGRW